MNEPEVPVIPAGDEEQEVLPVEVVQVMTDVALYVTSVGAAKADKVIVLAGRGAALEVASALTPPQDASPETRENVAKNIPNKILVLATVLFDTMEPSQSDYFWEDGDSILAT